MAITKSSTQSLKIYFVQIVTQNCTFLSFIGQVYWRVDSATTRFGLKNLFFILAACWLMSDVATYGHSVLGKSKDQLWLQGKCLHIDGLPFGQIVCVWFFFWFFYSPEQWGHLQWNRIFDLLIILCLAGEGFIFLLSSFFFNRKFQICAMSPHSPLTPLCS